ISFSTSVSVRCSRLRNSLFGRRLGATARFWVLGFTSRRFGFAGILASYHPTLLVQQSLYEQYARQLCASLGLGLRADHSGLMPANLITLAHFAVSSAISLP